MNIVVCLKQILDPEIPARDFRIDDATKKPIRGNSKMVIDSYSEYALEVAIQLRNALPGSKVTAVLVGDKPAEEVLRRAFSVTADHAVRAWDAGWPELDGGAVARVLAAAITKLGGADVVLLGRQAGDIERGVVGPMLAEALGMPCTTVVSRVTPSGDGLQLRREVEGGFNLVEAKLPAVVTVTNDETNVPRLPKIKDVMAASRKPIALYGAADLNVDAAALAPKIELRELFIPVLDGSCTIIDGDDGSAKAQNLTRRMRELKVV